ncbi:hypothetical protein ACHAPT_008739 [Fusarium lateritium]
MSSQILQFEFKTYEYDPLPTPSSIRLLSLATQRNNGPAVCGTPLIECALRTVDLAASPDFKALSYTWGNPFRTPADPAVGEYSSRQLWPLAVNGRVHFVTKNLFEALQQLFLDGVPVINRRFPPFEKTTLIRASESNDPDRVRYCLERGADVNLKDCFGETALHYAAGNGHLEVVKILLRYGANDEMRNKKGLIPLQGALTKKRGQYHKVAHVLRHADPFEIREKDRPIHSERPDNDTHELWIDAVCINQRDTDERTAQVALMSHIYSTAKSVVVWLGRESTFTQGAARALQGHGIPEKEMPNVKHLINRSWFTRKWVIQEFCLAKAIEMWCGAFRITCDRLLEYDLEHLLPALGASASPATKLQQGRRGLGIWDVLTLRRWFEQIRSAPLDCSSHLSPPSLPALMALTWHFQSADPRDSIFALLGIVNKFPIEGTPCNIVADYSKSTDEVFLEVGRLFVEAKGRNEIPQWNKNPEILEPLEGLSFVQLESPGPGESRPSWVPSFHKGLKTVRLWDHRFYASGKESHCTIWPSDPRHLRVDGCFLDRVTESEHGEGKQKATSALDIAAWFRMTLNLKVRYQEAYDVSRVEVLWRTLMADDIWNTQPQIARETFKEFICEHMQKCDKDAYQLLDKLSADDNSQSLPTPERIKQFKAPERDARAHSGGSYAVRSTASE